MQNLCRYAKQPWVYHCCCPYKGVLKLFFPDIPSRVARCPVFWLFVRYNNESNTGNCMCPMLGLLYLKYLNSSCHCSAFLREPPGKQHVIPSLFENFQPGFICW